MVLPPLPECLESAFVGVSIPHAHLLQNEAKLFTPASNTKLYTSWLACTLLGERSIFRSDYSYSDGTLYFRPKCNPMLSEASLRVLVEEMEDRKVREIVLSTGYSKAERYPPGWNFGDRGETWGAPISDVCFHENAVRAFFHRGESRPYRTEPSNLPFRYKFSKSITTKIVDKDTVYLPAGFGGRCSFAILEPELIFMKWLDRMLGPTRRKRVLRTGRFKGEPMPVATTGMREVLLKLNKASSNIIGELLLIHCAKREGRHPSTQGGSALLNQELRRNGIRDVILYDGSGLSRANLASPRSTVSLLTLIKQYETLISSLPVGGMDGTLKNRKLNEVVVAKTGSLEGVQTLSGYLDMKPFSIMVNHISSTGHAERKAKDWIDATAMLNI
jgi:D-alanyl-D-alanine carboxypeptidase/D-alanyl-D-alanine-endopeptidase (penicillin-binding protein 4)